ncbi:hypothetical protein Tco_0038878 [Tanacetum coccineum]
MVVGRKGATYYVWHRDVYDIGVCSVAGSFHVCVCRLAEERERSGGEDNEGELQYVVRRGLEKQPPLWVVIPFKSTFGISNGFTREGTPTEVRSGIGIMILEAMSLNGI